MEIFHGKQIYEWWIFHSHDSLTEAYISETCQESQLTFGFVVSQAFTHIEEVASTSTWGCLKIWNGKIEWFLVSISGYICQKRGEKKPPFFDKSH
jgi:hypothetical protein